MWSTPWWSNATPELKTEPNHVPHGQAPGDTGLPSELVSRPVAHRAVALVGRGARTPVIYGPYGMAWPLATPPQRPFVPKGPGIKGGGVAAVGAGVGLVCTIAVAVAYAIADPGGFKAKRPVVPPGEPAGPVGRLRRSRRLTRPGPTAPEPAPRTSACPGPARRRRARRGRCRRGSLPAAHRPRHHRPGREGFRQPERRLPGDPGNDSVGDGGMGDRRVPGGGGLRSSRSSSSADCSRVHSPDGSAPCPHSSSRRSSSASPT